MRAGGIQRINNGKSHWYKLDGQKADGVTTLIGEGIPKPALIGWSARTVAEYAADHLDEITFMRPMGREAIVDALKSQPFRDSNAAAVRGTRVHRFAEELAQGVIVEVPPELVGHVEQCARFLDAYDIEPVLRETVVASRRHGYCGTLDLVANGAIWDYKTSKSGIYGETALQEAAYLRADCYIDAGTEVRCATEGNPWATLAETFGIERAFAVQITEDDYDVYPLDVSDETFEFFLSAADVARRAGKKQERLRALVGDPLPKGASWTMT